MKPGLGDSLTRDSTDILRTLNTMDRAVDKSEVDPSRFGLNAGDLSRRFVLPWPWPLLQLYLQGLECYKASSIGRCGGRITWHWLLLQGLVALGVVVSISRGAGPCYKAL